MCVTKTQNYEVNCLFINNNQSLKQKATLTLILHSYFTMAEATSRDLEPEERKDFELECAICLQTCIHPAELPCGHIFCFLCVKGIALQSKKCALCRQYIPRDYIEHPTLVKLNAVPEKVRTQEDQYQWFYQGRNGWWQYDERANGEIERAYKLNQNSHEILICGQLYVIDFDNQCQFLKTNPVRKRYIKREISDNIDVKGWWQYDERTSLDLDQAYATGEIICELLIAGFTYVIDFKAMVQYRKDSPNRMRSIKRDSSNIPKKGIAGLRIDKKENGENTFVESNPCCTENQTPITPSNTPQSLNSERQSFEDETLLESLRSLQIDTSDNNNNSDNVDEISPGQGSS